MQGVGVLQKKKTNGQLWNKCNRRTQIEQLLFCSVREGGIDSRCDAMCRHYNIWTRLFFDVHKAPFFLEKIKIIILHERIDFCFYRKNQEIIKLFFKCRFYWQKAQMSQTRLLTFASILKIWDTKLKYRC